MQPETSKTVRKNTVEVASANRDSEAVPDRINAASASQTLDGADLQVDNVD